MFHNKNFLASLFRDNISYLADSDRHLFSDEENKHNLLVIGTGMIGREHIRITFLEGRATVRGLYDSNSRSLRQAENLIAQIAPGLAINTYDSLEAACSDPEIDGILICTPNHTHLEVLKIAVRSGKPILLEKPMATKLADAREILNMAGEHGSFIQVGLQYRYKAIYQEVYGHLFHRRSIGNLKLMNITEHRIPFLDKVNQWNKFAEYSGGTLVEKCCHYFDLFNLFSQSKPRVVSAIGDLAVNYKDFSYGGNESDVIDNAFVTVEYENGIKACFSLCMFSPMFHEEIVLCGDEGRMRAFETEDFLPGEKLKTGFELKTSNGQPGLNAVPHHPTIIEESGHSGATFYEHYDFIERIEGRTTRSATVEEGFWSVLVGMAAEQSVREGRKVFVDELLNS